MTAFAATPTARGQAVRLRNDLAAGTVNVYSLTVRTTRTAPPDGDRPSEVVTYIQAGRLTLAVLSPPKRSTVERAWMIELDEGRIEKLTRSGSEVPVTEQPPGAALGLPPRAAQLAVDAVTPTHAPAHAAGGNPFQQAAFLLALDVAHWPDGTVEPAARWQHELSQEFLEVVRSWTLEEVRGQGRQRQAAVTSTATGTFVGPLGGLAEIIRASSAFDWHVREHSLLSLTAEVELHYVSDGQARRLRSEVTLERADHRELSEAELEAAGNELAKLSAAIDVYNRGNPVGAAEALRSFEADHPGSLWLPVARDLGNKAKHEGKTLEGLTGDELTSVLIQLLARWQKIVVAGDTESLEPLRTTFADVARTRGEALCGLARADEAARRALAVFVLSFDESGARLGVVVSACDDPEPTVRAWAVYGLAERGDPQTDRDLLKRMLGDADAKVRQRACMAVERCVSPESPDRLPFVDLLLEMVRRDAVEDVRAFAAGALFRLAGAEHLRSVREALANERAGNVRKRLERIVERLEAASDSAGSNPG